MTRHCQKTVFISDASSGYGLLSARFFAEQGWNVVAAMRSPEKAEQLGLPEHILVVKVDVTSKEMIEAAVWQANSLFGSIDVLINNADDDGRDVPEKVSEEKIHRLVDANFPGISNVCQEIIPFMRKQGHGLIINMNSAAPKQSL